MIGLPRLQKLAESKDDSDPHEADFNFPEKDELVQLYKTEFEKYKEKNPNVKFFTWLLKQYGSDKENLQYSGSFSTGSGRKIEDYTIARWAKGQIAAARRGK